MKIYTKTGDKGDTSLFGGKRVPKSSLRIEAFGTVDEINAHLGYVRALKPDSRIQEIVEVIQNDLFILGADLSAPVGIESSKIPRIQLENIKWIENTIDKLDSELEKLDSFIIPGGTIVSAQLHIARAVCRRAERIVDALGRKENISPNPLIYLNRLADLLFVLARYSNKITGTEEVKWRVKGEYYSK